MYSHHMLAMCSAGGYHSPAIVFPSFEAGDEPQNDSINAEPISISSESKENTPPSVMTTSFLLASGPFLLLITGKEVMKVGVYGGEESGTNMHAHNIVSF